MLNADDCLMKGSQKLAYIHTYCQAETLKNISLWKDTNSYEN